MNNTPAGMPLNDVMAPPAPVQTPRSQPANKPVTGKKLSNTQQPQVAAIVVVTLLVVAILVVLIVVAYMKSQRA